jgi:hypothetical protein
LLLGEWKSSSKLNMNYLMTMKVTTKSNL